MPRKEYFEVHRWDGTLVARHVTRSVDANKIARDLSKRHGQSYVYLRDDSGKLIGIYHYVQSGNEVKVSFDGIKNPRTCFCGSRATKVISGSKGPIAYVCSKCLKQFSDPAFLKDVERKDVRTMPKDMYTHYTRHLRMAKKLNIRPMSPDEFSEKFVGGGRKKHTLQHNPKRVLIYARVNRIIATKTQKHICDAECKRHGHRYFHDFTSRPKMYGLPNGDLLITTR